MQPSVLRAGGYSVLLSGQPVQFVKRGIKRVALLPHDDEDLHAIVHSILKQLTDRTFAPRERVSRIDVRCDSIGTDKAS
jgi:hypothetical protein